jgi:hypothetical protein
LHMQHGKAGFAEKKTGLQRSPVSHHFNARFAPGAKRQLVVLTVTGLFRKGAVPTQSTAASA